MYILCVFNCINIYKGGRACSSSSSIYVYVIIKEMIGPLVVPVVRKLLFWSFLEHCGRNKVCVIIKEMFGPM